MSHQKGRSFNPMFLMMRMKGSASLALLALVYKMSHKACFGDLEKYQNPADLEIYFKLELAIELY